MDDMPDISGIAALVADPARARMLTALTSGTALTATELSLEAGILPSTASSHLGKLQDAGFLSMQRQGRHRYFRLADRRSPSCSRS
jgi:DNA-binding transcriptional ArsR family regulator